MAGDDKVSPRQVQDQRFSVTSSRSFREVAARIDAAVGHPDRRTFSRAAAEAKAYAELETLMHQVVGPSDLMEFARIDLGEILRKEPGNAASQSLRLVAGNPLIMRQMNGGACAGLQLLYARNHPDRPASGWCAPFLRPQDQLPGFLRKFGSFESSAGS